MTRMQIQSGHQSTKSFLGRTKFEPGNYMHMHGHGMTPAGNAVSETTMDTFP